MQDGGSIPSTLYSAVVCLGVLEQDTKSVPSLHLGNILEFRVWENLVLLFFESGTASHNV